MNKSVEKKVADLIDEIRREGSPVDTAKIKADIKEMRNILDEGIEFAGELNGTYYASETEIESFINKIDAKFEEIVDNLVF